MRIRSLLTENCGSSALLSHADHPDNVMIDLTQVCSQSCAFCYQNPSLRQHGDVGRLKELLKALADWGVREILYLGGEPTLHPDLEGIIRRGHDFGLEQRLITNGQHIGPKVLALFKENDVEVGVSLHGASQEMHDHATNTRGSFANALEALRNIEGYGIRNWVQYTFLSEARGTTLVDIHEFLNLHDVHPQKYDINRLIRYPHSHNSSFFPDPAHWLHFLHSLPDAAKAGLEIHVEAIPYCWLKKCSAKEKLSAAQVEKIFRLVRPCLMGFCQWAFSVNCLPKICPTACEDDDINDISLTRESLQMLWEDSPSLISRREMDFLGAPCILKNKALCVDFYSCLGGCRVACGQCGSSPDPLRDEITDMDLL